MITQACEITLISGIKFDVHKPDPDLIDIEIIAHSLSNLCRFLGHTRKFYSVAQHSVLVSKLCPKELSLQGLLHDASEAFCGDAPSPIKNNLKHYQKVEKGLYEQIALKYDLPAVLDAQVIAADRIALLTEASQLTNSRDWSTWYPELDPANVSIIPLTPDEAKTQFINRFEELAMALNNQSPDFAEELELCEQLDMADEEYWQEQAYDWQ